MASEKELDTSTLRELIAYLGSFLTDHKVGGFQEVLDNRTRHITIVLEDIHQTHNASATVRSCDCFGIQELNIIENENRFTINPAVTRGASKWVDLTRWNEKGVDNTPICLNHLKEKGYRIIATTPHTSACLLPDLPVDQPLAIMFGRERTGIRESALDLADEHVRIPMYGFTESYNISVSVALTLHDLVTRLHRSDVDWRLDERDRLEIEYRWITKVLKQKKCQHLERMFFEEHIR